MPRFEDWVTDPAVRRSDLEGFVHTPEKIGQPYLGKYTVCTTSGMTGHRIIIAGKSAEGGLCLATLLALRDRKAKPGERLD